MVIIRLFVLILMFGAALLGVNARVGDGAFEVFALDVGQGDAILIRTPENIKLLIDGGPAENIMSSLAKALGPLDKHIDLVVLTHPDADHFEGLIPVLSEYNVRAVVRTSAMKEGDGFAAFEQLMDDKQIQSVELYLGDRIKLGDQAEFLVLWPPEGDLDLKNPNESSIVGRLSFEPYHFLLTGDIASITESKIMAKIKSEYLQAQILKVGHHGSKHSTSDSFLKMVQPHISVISSGADNRYGHPASEVLERLKKAGSQILRTDLVGTIMLRVEEGVLSIR